MRPKATMTDDNQSQERRWALSWCPAPSLKRGELHGSEIRVIPSSTSEQISRVMEADAGNREGIALWIFSDDEPDMTIREALEAFYADLPSGHVPIPPILVMSSEAFKKIESRAVPPPEETAMLRDPRTPKEALCRALNMLKMEIAMGNLDPSVVAHSLDSPVMLTSILEQRAQKSNARGDRLWFHVVELIREAANNETEKAS